MFAHLPIVDGVYIGPHGPFRFAFDTGAESTSIDAQLAQKLKLTPQYRVEVVTAAASSLAPALRAPLRAGKVEMPDTEALLIPLSGEDGVLGQSALRHLDYQIDNEAKRVRFHASPGQGAPQESAIAIPLQYVGGRIALPVRIGGKVWELVLDSGTNAMVLPEAVSSFRPSGVARMRTHNGSAEVPYGFIPKIEVGGLSWKNTAVAIVGVASGLIPTQFFRRITVVNSAGMLYLEK
jgi:predicted aspartyl protease